MPGSISPPRTPRAADTHSSQSRTNSSQSVSSNLSNAAKAIASGISARRGRLQMSVCLDSSHCDKLPSNSSSEMSSAASSEVPSAESSAVSSPANSPVASSARSSDWRIRFKGTYENVESDSTSMRGTNLVLLMRDRTPGSEFQDQLVIKKVINLKAGSAGEELIRRKADAEVAALIRADGEGCAKYIEHIVKTNTYEIIMSFLEGKTLEQTMPWLREQSHEYKVNAVREITRGILTTVQALHEKDVCHRDIKPDNIMIEITEDDRFIVKLTDLGMASTLGDASPQSATLRDPGKNQDYLDNVARHSFGTSKYNIPNSWDKRAIDLDLASVGYTLVELLKKIDPEAAREVSENSAEEANSFNRPVIESSFFSNFPELASFIRELTPTAGKASDAEAMLPELQPDEIFARLKDLPWLNP